jgi:hypothetical protein
MNSENHDRRAVETTKHPASQDTNGVEEDINNHGSGNKQMPLRMV